MGRWLERLREQDDDARHHGARDDDAAVLAPRQGKSSATIPQAPHGMALAEIGGETPPTSIVSGPGVRIVPPASEVSAAEYDRHLDALIAEAGACTPEAARLAYAKRKGWVVPRGDGRIFTRGRY